MNRKTQGAVRKLKDADGNYLWQPAADAGRQGDADGLRRWSRSRTCRTSRRTRCSIAFGDFRRGYLIVDRQGVNVLRDPFSAKPYVLFYTTKRVGGGVQDFDAIKLLKFAREREPLTRLGSRPPLRNRARLRRGRRERGSSDPRAPADSAARPSGLPGRLSFHQDIAMTSYLLAGPAEEPVSLAEAKAFLRRRRQRRGRADHDADRGGAAACRGHDRRGR